MSRTFLKPFSAAALALWVVSGCHHGCPRPAPGPIAQPFPPAPGPGIPGPGAAPFAPMPKGAAPLPEPPIPPAPVQSKSFDPSQLLPDQDWKPGAGPSVRLYPPEVVESDGGAKKIQLRVPDAIDPGKAPPKVEEG